MTTIDLLDALRSRGIQLFVDGGRLRYRGPPGALDAPLRRAAAEHRTELLAHLGAPPRSEWNAEAAAAELRQALAVINRSMSATWLRSVHYNLLRVIRQQVSDYHALHNPQLFGFPAWIEAHVGRWRAEHECRNRRSTK
jgi:hypothetical protein